MPIAETVILALIRAAIPLLRVVETPERTEERRRRLAERQARAFDARRSRRSQGEP